VEILAMRRVYYLECDVWEERAKELRETLLHEEVQRRERKKKRHFTFEETKKKREEEKHLVNRKPWIPHPEMRDTVPNIALYSVLVGGLPSLPEQAIDPMNGGDAVHLTARDSIDWQLSLTAAFFDHCVPNQPGFSSSVAAVSIMPSSQAIAVAWRKWYKAARKLRRLRFIREQIAKRRHYDIVLETPDGDIEQGESTRNLQQSAKQQSSRGFLVSPWLTAAFGEDAYESPPPIYKSQSKNRDYYREVLGSVRDQDAEKQVFEAFHFGPEQTAVYTREFAQSSAACCPHGCFEGSIRRAKIDELLQMEREAEEAVHEANLALLNARRRAVRWEQHVDDEEDKEEEEEEEDVTKQPVTTPGEMIEILEEGEKSGSFSLGEAPAAKSPPVSPPTSTKKIGKHRKKATFDSIEYPSDMSFERDLFQKSSQQLSKRSRGNSPGMGSHSRLGSGNSEKTVINPDTVKKKSNHRLPGDPSLKANLTRGDNSDQELAKASSHELSSQDPLKSSSHSHQSKGDLGTPGTGKKDPKHRRKPTLETMLLPDDLGLEANLFQKASEHDLQHKNSDLNAKNTAFTNLIRQQNSAIDSSTGNAGDELFDLETPKMGNLESKSTDISDIKSTDDQISAPEIDVEVGEANHAARSDESRWSLVQDIVARVSQSERKSSKNRGKPKEISSGAWRVPSVRGILKKTRKTAVHGTTKIVKTVKDTAIDALDIQRESSYAVVTFTSRQAAVAARHCLPDGRGTDRWISYPDLPIPPIADAASGDLLACRNCCKPVTLSIDDRQKDYRKICSYGLLATIYIFYTIPLTAASKLVDPESIKEVFPSLSDWIDEHWGNGAELISGLLQSGIWTLFFALCPVLFRAIANFGSGATSFADAEYKALIYFWYFMTIAAFSTTLVSNMFLNGLNHGRLGGEFREVIREIARTIPYENSVVWLNWIIFRFTILLPVNYLLNVNAFIFDAINFKCCARVAMGGGPGAPTPYRIYVDSGIVLLCLMALAPASPIVAPACFTYFIFFQPILRRNLIYMYRPKFDGGGFRWPFIFDMCIACMVAGQVLLTTQMILKQAVGPAVAACIPVLPTVLFHRAMKRKYLRPFQDAALLQTSLLDGWDNIDNSSMEKREEFRQFLVDAHKAAYVPVCIASGDDEEGLTAEPAVVVPLETDVQKDLLDEPLYSPYQSQEIVMPQAEVTERRPVQHGATLRRAVNTLAAMKRRSDSVDGGSNIFASMRNLNIVPEPSPFDRRSSMATFKDPSANDKRAAFRRMTEKDAKDE